MKKITQHEMLVTLATMATLDDNFNAHDVIEVLSALGYRSIVVEAREGVKARKNLWLDCQDRDARKSSNR